jgi:septal ring factor EnvC (AmiA/AmiB activator)
MNKWKLAFFISLSVSILTLLGAGYLVLTNTIVSGNNYDNLITITEDIEHISKSVKNNAKTIEEFDKELKKQKSGHWTDTENNIIQLQIVMIEFDKNGDFEMIDTNQRNSTHGKTLN